MKIRAGFVSNSSSTSFTTVEVVVPQGFVAAQHDIARVIKTVLEEYYDIEDHCRYLGTEDCKNAGGCDDCKHHAAETDRTIKCVNKRIDGSINRLKNGKKVEDSQDDGTIDTRIAIHALIKIFQDNKLVMSFATVDDAEGYVSHTEVGDVITVVPITDKEANKRIQILQKAMSWSPGNFGNNKRED